MATATQRRRAGFGGDDATDEGEQNPSTFSSSALVVWSMRVHSL